MPRPSPPPSLPQPTPPPPSSANRKRRRAPHPSPDLVRRQGIFDQSQVGACSPFIVSLPIALARLPVGVTAFPFVFGSSTSLSHPFTASGWYVAHTSFWDVPADSAMAQCANTGNEIVSCFPTSDVTVPQHQLAYFVCKQSSPLGFLAAPSSIHRYSPSCAYI